MGDGLEHRPIWMVNAVADSGRAILISGGTGLLGRALTAHFRARGDAVRILSRRTGPGHLVWNPDRGVLDREALEGLDAVIHLAGEGIADRRWTAERKRELRTSREHPTRLLSTALASCTTPPALFCSASAVGIYGNRGDTILDESSSLGTGFLADVGRAWEDATLPASEGGIHTTLLRLGVVLTPEGGMLRRLLPVFRLGLGGPVGSGTQWMSWISLPDFVSAVSHLLDSPLPGPVNLVAPAPVRNHTFTRALGRALRRPAFLPVPALALRVALGDLAEEALLAGQRVRPTRLTEAGFAFSHPTVEAALSHLLGGAT